jgi:hypothetical protein
MLVTTDTMKIGRRPNKITIKRIDIYNEMFTNDIYRINQFIAISDYSDKIDPGVILEFNKHAVALSLQEFRYYFNAQNSENKIMMYLYENIFKDNKKIDKTLKKLMDNPKQCGEEELLYLIEWESSHQGHYHTMKKLYSKNI